MVDAYLAQAMRCSTVNQYNRLHITLENILAPAEIRALIDGVRARVVTAPEPVSHWFARWDTLLGTGQRPVQGYERHEVAPGVISYAAAGSAAERSERTLVYAFSGEANRLMMPIAMFLQSVPADRYEFVVLFDPSRHFYLRGVPTLGTSLPETIASLATRFPPSRHRRAMSLGTSAGGLAALWTGVALGLARAVSVGGITPWQVLERKQTQAIPLDAFDDLLRERAGRLPEIVLVSGEKHTRDNEKALAMSTLLPARHVTVAGSTHHNMLADAFAAGTLDALLEELLGEGDPAT